MKILIIGGTGLIGKYLCKNLKVREIYTLSRSYTNTNQNHFTVNLLHHQNFSSKINIKFDVIINCVSFKVIENINLENYFSNILNLLKNDNSTIIEISSLSTFNNIFNKKNNLTYYGKKKLQSEAVITNLIQNYKNNLFIYNLGAVCSKKDIDYFIFNKLKKLILGDIFFNFYKVNNCYFKISFLEDLADHINKIFITKNQYSKRIVLYQNINPINSLVKFKPNLKSINLNINILVFIISLFKKDLSLKLNMIFNFRIKTDHFKSQILNETKIYSKNH